MNPFLSKTLLPAALLLGACQTGRNTTTGASCYYGVAAGNRLELVPYNTRLTASEKPLPKAYTAYRAKGEKDFFRAAAKGDATFHLQLPKADCKAYRMVPSGSMSPELAQKYPDLVSLKGHSGNADLRLDWDGRQFRGQVLEGGKTWFVEPYSSGNDRIYLLFAKDDAPATKQPFEQSSGR